VKNVYKKLSFQFHYQLKNVYKKLYIIMTSQIIQYKK